MLFELLLWWLALGASAQSLNEPTSDSFGSIGLSSTSTVSAADAQTTISAFGVDSGVTGSIVSADACSTVLALQCDSEGNEYCMTASALGVTEITYTQKPTALEIDFSTAVDGGTGALSISCDFLGTSPSFTAEACTYSLSVSAGGRSTQTSTSTTITTAIPENGLPITAGAEKLPTGSATCSATTTGGVAPTAISEVYKILVPIGAVVAGAFL